MVGSQQGSRVLVFGRDRNTLERRKIVNLKNRAVDIKVADDGGAIVILNADRSSLHIIRDPKKWVLEKGSISGSDRIREAQKWLLALRYPIGRVVDGIDGPKTRRAVAIFQKIEGLEPSGTVDVNHAIL